ncbi:MAG: hypothetical protein E7574_06820 [Ruminococcaceae bacterium]|nr:hypothetical protein [Oscillospiraceae bacterium]
MAVLEKFYGKIESEKLLFDPNEVALRLKTERGYTNEIIDECKKILQNNVDCRYCAVKADVFVTDESTVDLGFLKTESKSLAKNLYGCTQCYIMAVTLGNKVDMLLKKMSVSSPAKHYITDALASALAESAADTAEAIIKGKSDCTLRFSPGYADLTLEIQPNVLNVLEASKYIGVTISKSLLMTPQKTITAFIGIKK